MLAGRPIYQLTDQNPSVRVSIDSSNPSLQRFKSRDGSKSATSYPGYRLVSVNLHIYQPIASGAKPE